MLWHQAPMLAADVSFNQPVFSAQMLDWIKIWGSWSTPLTSCCAPQWFLNYFCFVKGHMQAFPAEPICCPPIMQPRAMCSPVPCALHYPHDITCSFTAPGPVPMMTCPLLALSWVCMLDPELTGAMQNHLQQIAMHYVHFAHTQHELF